MKNIKLRNLTKDTGKKLTAEDKAKITEALSEYFPAIAEVYIKINIFDIVKVYKDRNFTNLLMLLDRDKDKIVMQLVNQPVTDDKIK